MTDQPTKNIAFEVMATNASLLFLSNLLLEIVEPGSHAEQRIRGEMNTIERRIERLDYLRK